MALAPEIRRQKLKLMAVKLRHEASISESREQLRKVKEQLANLKPKKPQGA